MTVMLNKFKFITSCLIKLALTTSEHFRPSPALLSPVLEFLFRSIPTLWTGNGTPTMLSFLLPAHRGSSGQRAVKRVCLSLEMWINSNGRRAPSSNGAQQKCGQCHVDDAEHQWRIQRTAICAVANEVPAQ